MAHGRRSERTGPSAPLPLRRGIFNGVIVFVIVVGAVVRMFVNVPDAVDVRVRMRVPVIVFGPSVGVGMDCAVIVAMR